MTYVPFYAEELCLVCGLWRGQHVDFGDPRENKNMRCQIEGDYFGTEPSFVPKPGSSRASKDRWF